MDEVIKDWRGRPITVGSKIVYPGRRGSSLWVTEALVKAAGYRDHPWRKDVRVPFLQVQILASTGFRFGNVQNVMLKKLGTVTVVG